MQLKTWAIIKGWKLENIEGWNAEILGGGIKDRIIEVRI